MGSSEYPIMSYLLVEARGLVYDGGELNRGG
jgi:hypothetical protein